MVTPRLKLRYHCVEVVAGSTGCPAAIELQGQRLLSADAPRLPLANCDRPGDCDCRYRHHEDRRHSARRAREQGQLARPWAYTERRQIRGRRDSDFE
jgi:hypothetical protein